MSFILAIDGTSGSGKTTTARKIAERLGWFYLDTGATYRAITYAVLECGKNPEEVRGVIQVLKGLKLDVKNSEDGQRTFVNSEDVTDCLRTDEIDKLVTPISKMKEVRKWLVKFQRKIARNKNIVVEGRDIGTVVFPYANLKIYMDAELPVRARRRKKQKVGFKDIGEIKNDLQRRDYHDFTRSESPLKRAPDALLLDTTYLSVNEQVEWVINRIEQLNESTASI